MMVRMLPAAVARLFFWGADIRSSRFLELVLCLLKFLLSFLELRIIVIWGVALCPSESCFP